MKYAATPSSSMLVTNGALRVPVTATIHSLKTPLIMAVTLLSVLMSPNVRERSPPLSASLRF